VWTTAPVIPPVPIMSGYGQYTRRNDASTLPQNVTQFYSHSADVRGRWGSGEQRTRYKCAHAPALPITSTSRTNTTSSFVRMEGCAPRTRYACMSSRVRSIIFSQEPTICGLGEHQGHRLARKSTYSPVEDIDGVGLDSGHGRLTEGL
jgi:hypothetical protein